LIVLPLPFVPNIFPTPVSGTRVRDRPRVLGSSGGCRRYRGSRRIVVRKVQGEPDGSRGDGFTTVRFGLDGVEFEVDLEPAEAVRLREFLGRYAVRARSVLREAEPAVRDGLPSPLRSLDVEELRAVRVWARGRGFSVSDRGRLPEAVLSAYEEAHPNARKGSHPPIPKIGNWPVT
jgi:hypothetical protein